MTKFRSGWYCNIFSNRKEVLLAMLKDFTAETF